MSVVPNLFLSNLQVPGYIQDPFVEATHVFSSGMRSILILVLYDIAKNLLCCLKSKIFV